MPQVKVSHSYTGKKKDVYKAVKAYLNGRDTLKKLGAEMEWDDAACSAEIKADSFDGAIAVSEKAGKSHVEISIQLPLLLTPFKGKVEEELKKHLGRVEV
jgi:hypothetical protein